VVGQGREAYLPGKRGAADVPGEGSLRAADLSGEGRPENLRGKRRAANLPCKGSLRAADLCAALLGS
jgi:hypothetical protein